VTAQAREFFSVPLRDYANPAAGAELLLSPSMMPRKVKLRWGETGVMKDPIFRLDEKQLFEIGKHLGQWCL